MPIDTHSLDALLPVLYVRGVSIGDFQEALAALLGADAPNLPPGVISRLTAGWQQDNDHWQHRALCTRSYVYMWANGGPASLLFRSGAHVKRPSARRPRVISSRGLSVCGAGCRSH